MRVLFCGVGEAFDEALPNTCLLVETFEGGQRREILLDCGFTAPYAYWRLGHLLDASPDGPDLVWLSHFHGDHFLGLPALAARLKQSGRRRTLTVAGRPGVGMAAAKALDLAYPGLRENLGYHLEFLELEPDEPRETLGMTLSAAWTTHPEPCLALRLEGPEGALYYSGDGAPTAECLALAWGVDLLVQEAFSLQAGHPGHGSLEEALELARMAQPKALALVHLARQVRQEVASRAAELQEAGGFVPEPGRVVDF